MVALAHNAVQYTARGDTIAIGSALHDGWVSFWVTDTGPGIAAHDAATIFDRFARGPLADNRALRSGAGLGLAVVAAIASAHGGTARLLSRPGEGAAFGIEIPTLAPGRREQGRVR